MTAEEVVLDVDALTDWVGDRLSGHGERFAAERMGQGVGVANALFFIRRGGREWVLRRPPAVKVHRTASDTSREWRILNALEGTAVPHPKPHLYCNDPGVIGSSFIVMQKIDGFTPGGGLSAPFDSNPHARWDLAMVYVDGLVELSRVDWRAAGLEGLGRPETFLERQVGRWLSQLEEYRTRTLPEESFLCRWLEDNRPPMSPAAILHGDYSPFNVMVTPALPARLVAIIDWDTATIGDPLLDIGHLLARWTEPGETSAIGRDTPALPGYPTRREMAQRYEAKTGRSLSALPYYQALSLFKLGVILEGRYARDRAAGLPDGLDPAGGAAPQLFRVAAEFARGQRT